MKKIPLEDTLGGAYRFLFTNVVSIIGTAWLPFVVSFALCGGLIYAAVPYAWWSGTFPEIKTPEAIIPLLMPFLAIYPVILFLMFVMSAMVLVGLMRHSLGQKTSPTYVYFSLGAPVWRMLGAFVLCYLLMVLLLVALVILFVLAYTVVYPHLPQAGGITLLVVLGIAETCFLIYAMVRLYFFIPAVVVAEERIGLGRSWSLGGGNFWRIVVIFLLITIPVGFVTNIIMQMTVMPMVMREVLKLQTHTGSVNTPHEAFALVSQVFHAIWPALPIIIVISLLQRIAIMGLVSGAIGKAYIALTKPDAQ